MQASLLFFNLKKRFLCGIIHSQKNKTQLIGRYTLVVGRRMPFGDKETAVKIRGNSHYRN